MKSALKFSSKVWLTTILIGPLIMTVKIYTLYSNDTEAWKAFYLVPFLGITYGILYFLAPWFILSVLCWYILKRNWPKNRAKIYLSITAAMLAIAPFAYMDYRSLFIINTGFLPGFPPDLFWTITYVCLTVGGIWFYKLIPLQNNAVKFDETQTVSP